jgi:short subunit dehydrogenase-like uncharacterized protein
MSASRTHDIVLFGATGFTGRLTAEYLARARRGQPGRWAIAGRDRGRLGQVRSDVLAVDPNADVDVIEASVDDADSLRAMARDASVVLNTVGPFARFGEPVVAACVESATDYADITGEPSFVARMIERYDAPARERGARIVHCCGFDSIPHDLGTLFTVNQLPEGEPLTVEGFVSASGTFSGGTWRSAIEGFGDRRSRLPLPKTPTPAEGRRVQGLPRRIHWDKTLHAWACPLPTIDPQIVLRSARMLDRYGPDFRYGHYVKVRSTARLALGLAGAATLIGLSQSATARKVLLNVRKSHEGPSAEQRAKSRFRVRFHGRAGSQSVETQVSGGDPGYEETAKMLGETGLCLALDELPPSAGVLTPAVAMGTRLIERLVKAGIKFEVL